MRSACGRFSGRNWQRGQAYTIFLGEVEILQAYGTHQFHEVFGISDVETIFEGFTQMKLRFVPVAADPLVWHFLLTGKLNEVPKTIL
jgi:hypothetical protein